MRLHGGRHTDSHGACYGVRTCGTYVQASVVPEIVFRPHAAKQSKGGGDVSKIELTRAQAKELFIIVQFFLRMNCRDDTRAMLEKIEIDLEEILR